MNTKQVGSLSGQIRIRSCGGGKMEGNRVFLAFAAGVIGMEWGEEFPYLFSGVSGSRVMMSDHAIRNRFFKRVASGLCLELLGHSYASGVSK